MTPSAIQQAAISRLFSSGVLRELGRLGRSPSFARLLSNLAGLSLTKNARCVGDVFDAAFNVLRKNGMRDEYIYRSAITQNILLGVYSLNTASMLSEFRVGTCRADVVILNGKSTAYEIKSERDSIFRLEKQILNYRKVFSHTYVICSESHLEPVASTIPSDVGIMTLSERGNISVRRSAEDIRAHIETATLFDSLRTKEAELILRACGLEIPELPNTQIRSALRQQFCLLDPVQAHDQMVKTLKHTRNLAALNLLVENLPRSLHAAALSVPLRASDRARLVHAVNTPIEVAVAWG